MSSTGPQFSDSRGNLPVGTFPAISDIPAGQAAMRQRIRELEALCAEVYEAGVMLGLPPTLLARVWMVAAHGNSPQGFTIDSDVPLPNVPLIHYPASPSVEMPLLPELTERRTVMVVEDDPAMLDLIVRILTTENYDLMTAESGDEALERLEGESTMPDLLLTDLMMPGIDGRQLAAALRKRAPGLRVLYETGFSDVLFKSKQELERGASFLEKPFSARGLMEAVRMALFGTMNPAAPAPMVTTRARRSWFFHRVE